VPDRLRSRPGVGLILGMSEEQLAAVRLYTSQEVVRMLRLRLTWLKNRITEERVPHVRAGRKRRVRFTAASILEIGGMLPGLLGGHCGASTAGDAQDRAGRVKQPTSGAVGEQLGNGGPSTSPAAVSAVIDLSA
jgi:hypothetical protein